MDKPESNKIYALTGTGKDKCISNGNTWKESEVVLCKTCKIPLKFYDGSLGYESLFCSKCGYYCDDINEVIKSKIYIL
jgi:hypothetical protein